MSVKGGLKGLKGVHKKESFEGATIRINRGGSAPPNPPPRGAATPLHPFFLKLNTRAVEFETSILPQNFSCYYYYYY